MKNHYSYSASQNVFLMNEWSESYIAADSWPADAIEVSEEVFNEFSVPEEGKIRVAGKDGLPAWADIPPPTHDELVAAAEAEKQQRIDQANDYMNSKQWPGKAAMGRLKDAEKVKYNAWLDYLDELEEVDTTAAPDITWPVPPEV